MKVEVYEKKNTHWPNTIVFYTCHRLHWRIWITYDCWQKKKYWTESEFLNKAKYREILMSSDVFLEGVIQRGRRYIPSSLRFRRHPSIAYNERNSLNFRSFFFYPLHLCNVKLISNHKQWFWCWYLFFISVSEIGEHPPDLQAHYFIII